MEDIGYTTDCCMCMSRKHKSSVQSILLLHIDRTKATHSTLELRKK